MHPNCRCVTITADAKLSTRIAKDPVTGENYKVNGNMDFQQWEESLTDEQRAVINKYVDKGTMHYIKGDIIKIKPGDGSSKLIKQLAQELKNEADRFESKIGELKYLKSVKSMRYMNNHIWGGYNDNSGEVILRGIGGKSGKATMVNVAKEMKKDGKWSTSSPYHDIDTNWHTVGCKSEKKRMDLQAKLIK